MSPVRVLRIEIPLSESTGATLMADAFVKKSSTLTAAVAEHPERRLGPRYGINADTEVEEPLAQAKVAGRTADIGMGGCYVDAMTTFPPGTEVRVRIKRGGQTFEAEARVLFGDYPFDSLNGKEQK